MGSRMFSRALWCGASLHSAVAFALIDWDFLLGDKGMICRLPLVFRDQWSVATGVSCSFFHVLF